MMTYKRIELQALTAFKTQPFEGYLWYSDQQMPKVFENDTADLTGLLTALPFVVEGMLYYPAQNRSLHIQNLDGQYIIGEVTHKQAMTEVKVVEWPAHRMGAVSKLKMVQGWAEQPHELLPGFTVKVPTFKAFVGFKKSSHGNQRSV